MSDELQQTIIALYGVGPLSHISNVEGGFLSHNISFEDSHGDRYFLKQYRKQLAPEVPSIHAVKKFFSNNNVPVILPIEHKDGKTYFECDGLTYAVFPFFDAGVQFTRDTITDTALESLGNMLAHIHTVGAHTTLGVAERKKRFDKDKFLARFEKIMPIINAIEKKTPFDELALEGMILKKKLVEKNELTEDDIGLAYDTLIHGDFHNYNVFFDSEGKITAVFDFEKTSRAPRVFELIRAIDFICFEGSFELENFRKARIFLNAYREKYPVSKEEFKKGMLMYYLTQMHSLWIEEVHYVNGSNRVDQFLSNKLTALTYLKDNLDEYCEKLLE